MDSNSSYNTNTIELNEKDDCFPFTESDEKNSANKKYENKLLFISQSFNKKKKRKRKEKLDNNFKKIKCNFFKKLKKLINTKLSKANSKFFFESFPQKFIADISKKTNSKALEKTYEELFDFSYNISNNIKSALEKKYKKNLKTLDYLNSENNSNISNISEWNKIKKMKYSELFEKYLISKEFEDSIKALEKTETESYIYQYINLAKNFIDYFKETKTSNKSTNNTINNNIKTNTNIPPKKEKEKDKKIEIVIENISKPKEIEVKKENGDDIFFFNDEIFDAFGEFKEENLNNYFGDKIFDDEEDKLFILSDKKEELNSEEFNFFFSSDTKERLFFTKSN